MSATNSERRRSKRFDTPLDIEYRTLTQNPLYGNSIARNVSKGGIAFPSKGPVEKGTSVELKMNVPGDNIPVFASGTVTWADDSHTGVKITKIAKLDQVRILEYIYSEWLKTKKTNGRSTIKPHKRSHKKKQ